MVVYSNFVQRGRLHDRHRGLTQQQDDLTLIESSNRVATAKRFNHASSWRARSSPPVQLDHPGGDDLLQGASEAIPSPPANPARLWLANASSNIEMGLPAHIMAPSIIPWSEMPSYDVDHPHSSANSLEEQPMSAPESNAPNLDNDTIMGMLEEAGFADQQWDLSW